MPPTAHVATPRLVPSADAPAWRHIAATSPILWWTGLALLALSAATAVPMLSGADPRTLVGVSVWLKPWKFEVSAAIQLLTMAWAAAHVPRLATSRRWRTVEWIAAFVALAEIAYITWRASRGESSHFNRASPAAMVAFGLMGAGAVVLTLTAGVAGVFVARARDFVGSAVLQRGLAIGLIGGCIAGVVTGFALGAHGGHWVGGLHDDAGGLPLFRWARDGGDLRVAHFFGLHAMQAIPLVAWVVGLGRVDAARAHRVVVVTAVVWFAWTAFTFAQALAGVPLIG